MKGKKQLTDKAKLQRRNELLNIYNELGKGSLHWYRAAHLARLVKKPPDSVPWFFKR